MPDTISQNTSPQQKPYFLVGLLCIIALLILGAVFFKERVAFGDTAYQAVLLLIEQKPVVNWVRAGSMIPQIIPLMAIWLHASLKTVMVLHSMSFLIFFLVIYLFAYRYSKKHLLFFVIPLYLVLITNEVFYWPQSELQQGMLWLCLYAVFLFEDKWSEMNITKAWVLHFLFMLWIQFFHPLIFFPMSFMVIYYYAGREELFSKRSLTHLSICVVCFVVRYVVGLFNIYERGKLNMGAAIKNNLPHFFSLSSLHSFLHKLPYEYSLYLAMLILAALYLTVSKKKWKATALASFSIGYWVLIMIAGADDYRFYTENMLLPLGFIAALPVVVDILPRFQSYTVIVIVVLIISVRLFFIYQAHDDYTRRFEIYASYFKYVEAKKLNGVFVDEQSIDSKKMIMSWGSGYESILISSLSSPDSCMVVQIDKDADHYSYALGSDTSLVTIYGIWDKSKLPPRYFKLRGGKYEIIHQPL
jgi:hypothetical protein